MNPWTREAIGGKGADVYEPPHGRPRFGILFLHGIGGESLRDRPAFTRLFDELNLACVCAEGARAWWADRICAEFDPALTPERHLLDHVVPFFEKRWGLRPPSIGLLGIGMGGQGALRLAFKQPGRFRAVAGISSALDFHDAFGQGTPLDEMYDSKEHARQDTAILHISPAEYPRHIFFCIDPDDADWHRGNDRLSEKLAALGIEHTAILQEVAPATPFQGVPPGSHSWEYFERMAEPAVRFLYHGLEKESRRLL